MGCWDTWQVQDNIDQAETLCEESLALYPGDRRHRQEWELAAPFF